MTGQASPPRDTISRGLQAFLIFRMVLYVMLAAVCILWAAFFAKDVLLFGRIVTAAFGLFLVWHSFRAWRVYQQQARPSASD